VNNYNNNNNNNNNRLRDKIENNEMGGAEARVGGKERHRQDFGGKTDGKRPLGRLMRRWEDNIKINLQEV
jgi:hypothetical protein